MGDIDFEELDRVISAFVTKKPQKTASVPKTKKAKEIKSKETTDLMDKAESNGTTTPSSDVTKNKQIIGPKVVKRDILEGSVKLSPASQRSSGRFMDVIHPTVTNLKNKIKSDSQPEPEVNSSKPEEVSNDLPAESLDSVFLSDTKVEKRPLSLKQDRVESLSKESLLDTHNLTDTKPSRGAKPVFKPATETDKAVSQPSEIVPNIVPQYKEAPPKEVQSIPIYDTSVFSREDGQKKSGWWLVLWIIGLIVLGISSGLLTYYYILPLI